MSEEKKFTAKEVASAIMEKTEELCKKHQHIGWEKLHEKLKSQGYSEKSANKIAGAIKAKVHPANKSEEMEKADGETKHDRCVRHVEENNPSIKNPHAVCVAAGVRPESWKKAEAAEVIKENQDVQESPAPNEDKDAIRNQGAKAYGSLPKNKEEYATEKQSYQKLKNFIDYMKAKRRLKHNG